MTFYDMKGPVRKVLPAIIAGITLFICGALSIGGVNMFGAYFGFGFLPLLVLAVWPRHANTLVSVVIIFFAGLFTDWGTGGVVGQWALVFLVIWGVFRPELRSSPFAPIGLFFVWLAICGISLILLSLSGRFVFEVAPDMSAIGRQIILATILLPVAIGLRFLVSARIGENEAWGS